MKESEIEELKAILDEYGLTIGIYETDPEENVLVIIAGNPDYLNSISDELDLFDDIKIKNDNKEKMH